jgi:hypothetical protein
MGRGDPTDAEWERLRPFLPVGNGRADRVTVVGRERHASRWIVIDMATRHLHGFRPKLVHAPRVLERLREAGRERGLGADYAADVSVTLERYARQCRAETAPYSPHPDRCLCHACLTGESG